MRLLAVLAVLAVLVVLGGCGASGPAIGSPCDAAAFDFQCEGAASAAFCEGGVWARYSVKLCSTTEEVMAVSFVGQAGKACPVVFRNDRECDGADRKIACDAQSGTWIGSDCRGCNGSDGNLTCN